MRPRRHLGRPHAETGPAIVYGDGLAVFAWHGVVVPEWAIGTRTSSRRDIDRQRNVEVRRVLVERFGAERLIREGGAAPWSTRTRPVASGGVAVRGRDARGGQPVRRSSIVVGRGR